MQLFLQVVLLGSKLAIWGSFLPHATPSCSTFSFPLGKEVLSRSGAGGRWEGGVSFLSFRSFEGSSAPGRRARVALLEANLPRRFSVRFEE